MSLLFATQMTAVATAILAAGAVVTAIYAIRAFRSQSAEVGLLREQAARDSKQRHQEQAIRVFAWTEQRPFERPDDMRSAACLRNTSQQPIYDVSLGWSTSGQHRWPVLLPGGEQIIPGAGSSVADGTVPVWAEFGDAAGNRWRTTSTGELAELP